MSGLLQLTWYDRFKREMQAIGCKFSPGASMFDDEAIEVPRDRMKEAQQIIAKYSDRSQRKAKL